jgi:uncharacterized SAM-binding protein YcdF (DUF218 family)
VRPLIPCAPFGPGRSWLATDGRAGAPDDGDLVDRSAADSLARSFRLSDRESWRVGRRSEERPNWRRPSWRRIIAAVVAVVVAYYLVTLAQVVWVGRDHDNGPVDAIVVLGAAQYDGDPSPQLAARLDHALALWDRGVAPWIMVTGGKRPGDRFTEAAASRAYLVERGVPSSVILDETEGTSTFESLDVAADLLLARGLERVVLVTDPYHAYRSELSAREVGLDADTASTPSSVVRGWSSFRRHAEEAAGVALGRLVGFDRLHRLTD